MAATTENITEILNKPFITDDAVVFGLLMCCLGIVFYTSQLKNLKWFYKIIPALLMCYLLPALLSTFNSSLSVFLLCAVRSNPLYTNWII